MKPPSRARSKPTRYFQRRTDATPQRPRQLLCTWKRMEQRQLISALRKLSNIVGSTGEVDYAFLNQQLPQHSIPEICAVVEALKARAITYVRDQVRRQRREEARIKKPIELWTHMASTMTGALEDPICTAFSQMLIVSSTEPRSLRNSDPPHVLSADRPKPPGDRTIPFRPIPRPVDPDQLPGTINAAPPPLILKTPAPTMGPATRLPAPSQVIRLVSTPQPQPSAATPVPGSPQPQHPPNTSQASAVSVQPLSQTATPPASPCVPVQQPPPSAAISSTPSCSSSPSPAVPPSSSSSPSSSPSSIPATVSSSTTSCSTPPAIPSSSSPTPAAALHARFGRTSKYAREDSPRALGMKCIVDFEKIYRYLSIINNEREECILTPMESAVVLDLLMSLPEELPLLDCNKLKRHMMQVHTQLSAPASSKVPRELFEDQRSERQQDGVGAEQEQITPGAEALRSSSGGGLQTQVGRGGAIGPNLVDQGSDRINSINRGDTAIATAESPGNLAAGDGAESSVATGSATAQRVDGRAQSQSSEGNNTFSQSGESIQERPDWEKAGLRPLNPFMVPLKLLARHHPK